MFASNTSAANGAATYIEDVFSTYLYTGNNSTQTITNGIDLSTKGGLVWIKNRISAFGNHLLSDSARGSGTTVYKTLSSNLTDAQNTTTNDGVSAFNANGFNVTGSSTAANDSGSTYASWAFRKQPKFFDVVTYTGTGSARTVAHNLGSVPGCILIKCIDNGFSWFVYHRGLGATKRLLLNDTSIAATESDVWNDTEPTATNFTLGSRLQTNGSGYNYVAYLFAHDAGGFGLTGTDNVISCGSYTGNGSATGPVVTLGYEPQLVLVKRASGGTANWFLYDTMRGFPTATGSETRYPLIPNSTDNETTYSGGAGLYPIPTGFSINTSGSNFNASGNTYIYIAIRRGPMKVPTSGTSVFAANKHTVSVGTKRQIGFAADLTLTKATGIVTGTSDSDRLRGYAPTNVTGYPQLLTSATDAESTGSGPYAYAIDNTSFTDGPALNGAPAVFWNFRRAPGFFDVVCYTGTNVSGRTVNHNLGVAPELMILKRRNGVSSWHVYTATTGASNELYLNDPSAVASSTWLNSTAPTATVFTLNSGAPFNGTGDTVVAYLFATCPGVSKVGSYTGNGSTQTINCGFTGGARFVLIKSTSAAGHWRVYDTARGIVAGNEPELFLNLTNAEQTVYDAIDTDSSGFIVNSNGANVNDSGVTYIFLAIA